MAIEPNYNFFFLCFATADTESVSEYHIFAAMRHHRQCYRAIRINMTGKVPPTLFYVKDFTSHSTA